MNEEKRAEIQKKLNKAKLEKANIEGRIGRLQAQLDTGLARYSKVKGKTVKTTEKSKETPEKPKKESSSIFDF